MKKQTFFYDAIIKIALPITIQSLIQASFSVVDQLMVGRIGTVPVAGIGLAGKFASLYMVIASAIAAVAGILIAQYVGNKNDEGISKSFYINSLIIGAIAIVFTVIGIGATDTIMSVYSEDGDTIQMASAYLRIIAIGFVPLAGSSMLSTLLRCKSYVKIPLYASIASAGIDTGLNYLLIFGKLGLPKMGVEGAAWATTIAKFIEILILLFFVIRLYRKKVLSLRFTIKADRDFMEKLLAILFPILVCEFLWSLGENIYAVIYGRIGTDSCAAMTLINPIQALLIGALTGVSAAAGIIVGKRQGEGAHTLAYDEGKKFVIYGIIGSVALSIIVFLTRGYYVQIFNVEDNVRELTSYILIAYAIIAPVKVSNMILEGGILRSGGKTKYVMYIDAIGTWGIGVPLGLLTGFALHLPIYMVYFILSLEEGVRLIISLVIFKKKIWMNQLT